MNSLSQLGLSQTVSVRHKVSTLAPGFRCQFGSDAASFLSEHYGAPVMLFALLLGMGLSFYRSRDDAKQALNLLHEP